MVSLLDIQARLRPEPVTAAILADALGCSVHAVRAGLRELEARGAAARVANRWIRVEEPQTPRRMLQTRTRM